MTSFPINVDDLLDHPTTVWTVLNKLSISVLSQARMMNGLADKGLHADSGHHEVIFKTHLQAVSSVLDGVFPSSDFEEFLKREKLIEGVYLDAADEEDPYRDTIGLLRRVVQTWNGA